MKTSIIIANTNALNDLQKLINKTNKHLTEGISILNHTLVNRTFVHQFIMDGELYENKIEKEVIEVELSYPNFNDWQLVAKIDYEKGIQPTDLTKELVFKNPSHGLDYFRCDCCGHKVRKASYVIENVNTGEELQVGTECLKTYGIRGMDLVSKFVCQLYKFSVMSEGDYVPYGGYGRVTIDDVIKPATSVFSACLDYYRTHEGKWEKGYYDDWNRMYYPSKSATEIKGNLFTDKFSELDEEYYNKVKDYTLSQYGDLLKEEDEYLSNFNRNMALAFTNFYMKICSCHFMFFAIKNYEDYLKQLANPNPYKVGEQLHIIGKIIKTEYFENMYGGYSEYNEIQCGDLILERDGKVCRDNNNNVDTYAIIKFFRKNGKIGLDRCTKHPKKGIPVTELA